MKAILFDKDGTLVDFDRTWADTNRKGALLAADGDAALADRLLARLRDGSADRGDIGRTACLPPPMPPKSRRTWSHMAALTSEGSYAAMLDKTFVEGAESPWPICDLDPH
jgi:phosphoglycolate phosphatase